MTDINIKLARLINDKLTEPVYFRAVQLPDGDLKIEQIRFLRTEELAALIGVEDRTIRGWVAKGQVPYHKAPGSSVNLFELNEIMRWIEQGGLDTGKRREVA
jgi:excisionase family DNA binding protein